MPERAMLSVARMGVAVRVRTSTCRAMLLQALLVDHPEAHAPRPTDEKAQALEPDILLEAGGCVPMRMSTLPFSTPRSVSLTCAALRKRLRRRCARDGRGSARGR
jgi:hypothetical protein